MIVLLHLLLACWGDRAYIVEGVVVEVTPPSEVVLDHEAVAGLMGPMVMAFDVQDPAMLDGLRPGTRVVARYELLDRGSQLTRVRITGQGPPPDIQLPPAPLRPGQALERTEVQTHRGDALVLGEGQTGPVALTFLYTRCPLPEACPALVARYQALQEQLGDRGTLVAVTLDPDHDTVEVLAAYAEQVGAGPRWTFARMERDALEDLALRAGMSILRDSDQILHGLRVLVLDDQGRLVERYDDAKFPASRVLEQLGSAPDPK